MIPDPEHKRIHMISLPDIVSSSTGHSDEVILIRAKERKHALQNRTTSFVAQSSRNVKNSFFKSSFSGSGGQKDSDRTGGRPFRV